MQIVTMISASGIARHPTIFTQILSSMLIRPAQSLFPLAKRARMELFPRLVTIPFVLSIAVTSILLSLFGLNFEEALILTIASLSTTGPLVNAASQSGIDLIALAPAAKIVFAGAMVLGRLETLAIIALLNPEFWR